MVSKPQSFHPEGACKFTRQGDKGYITYKSRRQQGTYNIFHTEQEEEVNQPEAEQEGNMGDNNEDRALQILEGLANGKQ